MECRPVLQRLQLKLQQEYSRDSKSDLSKFRSIHNQDFLKISGASNGGSIKKQAICPVLRMVKTRWRPTILKARPFGT